MMIATRRAGEMMGGVIEDLAVLRYVPCRSGRAILFAVLTSQRRGDTVTATVIHTGGVTAQ
jgi:hypothetical protein